MQTIDRTDEPPPSCLSDERAAAARDLLRVIFDADESKIAQQRFNMTSVMVVDELDQACQTVPGEVRLLRGA